MNKQPTGEEIKKFHLGIYAVIEEENRILLVKKSKGPYRGMWDLPGGRPNHGETIFQTLKREVKEETGIEIHDIVFLLNQAFIVNYMEGEESVSLHQTCLIYKASRFDSSQFRSNIIEEDVSGSAWIKKNELEQLSTSKVAFCLHQIF